MRVNRRWIHDANDSQFRTYHDFPGMMIHDDFYQAWGILGRVFQPYETNKWRSNYLDVVGIGQAPNWITNKFMSWGGWKIDDTPALLQRFCCDFIRGMKGWNDPCGDALPPWRNLSDPKVAILRPLLPPVMPLPLKKDVKVGENADAERVSWSNIPNSNSSFRRNP